MFIVSVRIQKPCPEMQNIKGFQSALEYPEQFEILGILKFTECFSVGIKKVL